MDKNNKILLHHFCLYHEVELSFIDSLHEYGLITIIVVNDDKYILEDDLKEIEKMVHFYYELGINIEGIEVIINL
ncbi:MAG: chaperone modulator CbpM, partial [Saprospiraceae bacterium]